MSKKSYMWVLPSVIFRVVAFILGILSFMYPWMVITFQSIRDEELVSYLNVFFIPFVLIHLVGTIAFIMAYKKEGLQKRMRTIGFFSSIVSYLIYIILVFGIYQVNLPSFPTAVIELGPGYILPILVIILLTADVIFQTETVKEKIQVWQNTREITYEQRVKNKEQRREEKRVKSENRKIKKEQKKAARIAQRNEKQAKQEEEKRLQALRAFEEEQKVREEYEKRKVLHELEPNLEHASTSAIAESPEIPLALSIRNDGVPKTQKIASFLKKSKAITNTVARISKDLTGENIFDSLNTDNSETSTSSESCPNPLDIVNKGLKFYKRMQKSKKPSKAAPIIANDSLSSQLPRDGSIQNKILGTLKIEHKVKLDEINKLFNISEEMARNQIYALLGANKLEGRFTDDEKVFIPHANLKDKILGILRIHGKINYEQLKQRYGLKSHEFEDIIYELAGQSKIEGKFNDALTEFSLISS